MIYSALLMCIKVALKRRIPTIILQDDLSVGANIFFVAQSGGGSNPPIHL